MTTVNQSVTGALDSNGYSITLTATGTLAADGSGTLALRSTLNSTNNNFADWTINSSILETEFSTPNTVVASNSVQRTLAKNSSLLVAQGSFTLPARTTATTLRFVADSDGVGTETFIPNATRAVLIFTLPAPIPPGPIPSAFTNTPFPNGSVSQSPQYDHTVVSENATSISLVSGTLPSGLTGSFVTSPSPGYRLFGTPTTVQSRSITLRASNANGSLDYTQTINITAAVPGTPTITSTSSTITSSTTSSITINWSAATNATGYKVGIREGTGSISTYTTTVGTSSHTFPNLKQATTYRVGVLAVNGTVEGTATTTLVTTAASASWSTIPTLTFKIGVPIPSNTSIATYASNAKTDGFSFSGTKPDWLSISSTGVLSGTPQQRASRNLTAESQGLLDQYNFSVTAQSIDGSSTATTSIRINVVFPGRRFGAGGWTQLSIARRYDGNTWVPIQNVLRRTGSLQSNRTPPTTT